MGKGQNITVTQNNNFTETPGTNPSESNDSTSEVFADELEILIRSRYPLIGIQSWEEERVTQIVTAVAGNLNKRIFGWSAAQGLAPLDIKKQNRPIDTSSNDPMVIIRKIQDLVEPAIYIFYDFHPYLKEASIVRMLRDVVKDFKYSLKTLILVSPHIPVPTELEKDLTLTELPLPGTKDLAVLLDEILEEINKRRDIQLDLDSVTRERLIQGTQGLTLTEAENVLARAIVSQGNLSMEALNLIICEKEQIIKRSGVLEFYNSAEQFESIGGLEYLKDWLRKRGKSFSSKARDFGLPAPKGILLIGVQGCGKSLTAKAVASYWSMPLLKLDVGSLFSSLVGSTEENLRKALGTAESVAPAILWVDEIEKGFAGVESSGRLDAGTSARVFGGLITWLQEKTSPVFVIATANDISRLPPEMLRKGRFDEIFFIDLPTDRERLEIFRIHLSKRGFDPDNFDMSHLIRISSGYSGAEIESSIISAMFDVFDEEIDMDTVSIEKALKETVPLSRLMEEKVEELRKWSIGRVRRGSLPETAANE
jgi:ATP-dependent 26S proteasome regulatory subunit